MGAATLPLPRTHAEEALISAAATRLAEHDAADLADALRACRVHLHPYRTGRHRFGCGVAQFEATVKAPPRAWRTLTNHGEDSTRLLRAELGASLRPLHVVRSLQVLRIG